MGWQYQHPRWTGELRRHGARQSMSRKGNCLDNGATEQVFGHLKDEFFRGVEWADFESFKRDLDAYVVHWNTRRRQVALGGLTPVEFRKRLLKASKCSLLIKKAKIRDAVQMSDFTHLSLSPMSRLENSSRTSLKNSSPGFTISLEKWQKANNGG